MSTLHSSEQQGRLGHFIVVIFMSSRMSFRRDTMQCIIKDRLGGGIAQLWESRSWLEHINCAMY